MTDFDSKTCKNAIKVSKSPKKALKTKNQNICNKKQNKIFNLSSLYHETHF